MARGLMRARRRRALGGILLVGLTIFAITPIALSQPVDSAEYQSYLAHVAAACGSLRLSEGGEAQRWLAHAPSKYRGWEWAFLSAFSDRSLASFELGDTLPTKLSWSPDGMQLILPMSDGSVRFFDAGTFTENRRLTEHTSVVYGARMHANGRLVSCSRGGTIRCTDVVSGDSLWTVLGGGQGLADIDISPDGNQIVYSSWIRSDSGVVGIVSLWDAMTGQKVWDTEYGDKPIVVCRYSPDGAKLAVGTWGWRVAVWELSQMGKPKVFDFDDVPAYSAIDGIAWTPDSKSIISGTRNGTPRVWNVETGELTHELRGHRHPVTAVASSSDGKRFYTAGDDGTIIVWDAASGRLLTSLHGHTSDIRSLGIRAQDGRIASFSVDGTVRIWDGLSGTEFSEESGLSPYNYTLPMTLDGALLASAGSAGSISIWDASGGLVRNFPALSELVNDAAFSPDGRLLGVVNWDSTVRIFNVADGLPVQDLHGQDGGSSSCSFSADGGHFASGSTNNNIVIWDVSSGEVLHRLALPTSAYRVTYSRDGKYLASGDRSGNIVLWDASTYDSLISIPASKGTVYNLDFSPDGWLLASVSDDGTARVWRLPVGDLFAEFKGHAGRTSCVAWHPDGTRLVTSSDDLTVRMWDVKTGQTTLIFSDFRDPVFNLAFSPDGKRLYSSTAGSDIVIWDTVPQRDRKR